MRHSLRRTVLAGVIAAVAATAAVPSYAHHDNGKGNGKAHGHGKQQAREQADACTGDPAAVQRMELAVEGQQALALVALPAKKPRGIVVFDHGYGHTMESWRRHLARTSANLGVIAIAPDYRGQRIVGVRKDGLPISRGWRVAEGAADTIAYAKRFEELCKPTGINVVYGVSMGGNTSGLAVASKPQGPDGKPLFDYWVNVEGVANVTQTYLGARSLALGLEVAKNAQIDIEEEMGGPFEEKSSVYAERTVVNRVGDIAASGIRGVVMVHGVADGLVGHEQSRQLQTRLRMAGVKVDMWSAVTRTADSEAGTTYDGYVIGEQSRFAGHASESSETHVVGLAGFAALDRLYSAKEFTCGEAIFDGTVNSTVRVTSTGC